MALKNRHLGSVVQKTLKRPVYGTGIGLHSGQRIAVALRPGPVDGGIVFVRSDLPAAQAVIPALWDKVTDTRLCTLLSNEHGVSVGTVEHLMAALRGCEVDNLVVEINGPEVPILDGSAEPWVAMIRTAGVVRQAARRRFIKVLKPVTVIEGDKAVTLAPAEAAQFTVEIDFPSAAVGAQKRSLALVNGGFQRGVAGARTFGFAHEVEHLRKMGLARGGSLENAIVIDGDTVLNEDGLRYKDEFVRHKILDSVGDLYLAGAPILGHYHGRKPGHRLNNELLRALFAQPDAWTWITADQVEAATPGRIPAALEA